MDITTLPDVILGGGGDWLWEMFFVVLSTLMLSIPSGTSSEAVVHPTFGQKFVGAASGSVLEMHGQPKKSWTKLTGTVTPNNGSCGFVYDSWVRGFLIIPTERPILKF